MFNFNGTIVNNVACFKIVKARESTNTFINKKKFTSILSLINAQVSVWACPCKISYLLLFKEQ